MNTNYKKNRPSGKFNHKAKHKQAKAKPKSNLDPQRLIQRSEVLETKAYKASRKFEQMDLHNGIQSNLRKMGFEYPTEIQERTFDDLYNKRDLIGIANTGTGKTCAFLLPIIQHFLVNPERKVPALIIVPTRELALQVEDEFKKLTKGLGLRISCHIGGTSVNADIDRLQRKNDVIVGTPGRLLDLLNRGNLRLNTTETLVLDEFDRMLDMGFIKDIRSIVRMLKNRKQTMLFSATLNPGQKSIIREMVQNPVEVHVSKGNSTTKNVEQDIIKVPNGGNKFDLLVNLLNNAGFEKVILFTETKRLADRLSKRLNKSGITADQIHGNKSQNYRLKALSRFKRGNIRILVATDVAARGVDIENVSHVINYQMPRDFDTYIHRIGRTGRAGRTGIAFTFVD
ncbi:MAG: DEAD/DEAH box helicase [Crocinitomicaceae bacterium]|nr:DEAD/DEAH box helicase [Crocinitomicaceae bacterium]